MRSNSQSVRVAVARVLLVAALAAQGGVAWAESSGNSTSNRQSEEHNDSSGVLAEVVVTAQKREERLEDVPVPVTSVDPRALADNAQNDLRSYFYQIPGLNYSANGKGSPAVSIRGLATGTDSVNPTVGIIVDDVPMGSSTWLGGGDSAPELDPSDLSHIEVLRGPQGTLYGASSIGGLIKYVTVDPSTDALKGRLQVGIDSVDGGKWGHSARGSINVPIGDTLAVMGSAFTHQDAGFIDNVFTGSNNINDSRTSGARLSALWRPSGDLSLKLSALYQHTKREASNDSQVGSGLGDLNQIYFRGAGALDRTLQAYIATANLTLGSVQLTSVTGYTANAQTDSVDFTASFGFLDGISSGIIGVPDNTSRPGVTDNFKNSKFTQELRLSTQLGNRVDWLFGAFYSHERSPFSQSVTAVNPTGGQTVAQWINFSWAVTYAEYAAFTNVTLHFTDNFDVQVGAREARIEQSYFEIDSGLATPFFDGAQSPFYYPKVETQDNTFTYLVTPRLKLSPDFMIYARLASGYRPGGPNATASPFGLPLSYKPDKARNYEIGVKGDFLDNRLSFDASLYYIDWKNVQLGFVFTNGFNYNGNGGLAKSEGIELSAKARLFGGLTASGWVALNKAVLTEDFISTSALSGSSGDRLPGASRVSGNFSLREEIPISSQLTGFVEGVVSYVGDRAGNFELRVVPVPRAQYPQYVQTDLRAGLQQESWKLNAFVNNLANRRGILSGVQGNSTFPDSVLYIQPRTIGLSVSKDF